MWHTCRHNDTPVGTMTYLQALWHTCRHYDTPAGIMTHLQALWHTCRHGHYDIPAGTGTMTYLQAQALWRSCVAPSCPCPGTRYTGWGWARGRRDSAGMWSASWRVPCWLSPVTSAGTHTHNQGQIHSYATNPNIQATKLFIIKITYLLNKLMARSLANRRKYTLLGLNLNAILVTICLVSCVGFPPNDNHIANFVLWAHATQCYIQNLE